MYLYEYTLFLLYIIKALGLSKKLILLLYPVGQLHSYYSVKHIDGQGILYDLQHGFREKRPCETQLIMLIEDLAMSASVGKQADIKQPHRGST